MKTITIIAVIFVPIFSFGATLKDDSVKYLVCGDSTLFEKLIDISEKEKISNQDFNDCLIIVDSLDECDFYYKTIGNEIYAITSLTFLFGEICYKTNTPKATNSYMDYRIRYMGSAEEQLSFSFEQLFTIQPKLIMDEIKKKDEKLQKELLQDLAWGFCNNRAMGTEDPYKDDPFKAMTYYDDTLKRVLTSKNYKELFYKVNPQVKLLYPFYTESIDFLLNEIKETVIWWEEMDEKRRNNNR
jgi:hypothetical protein